MKKTVLVLGLLSLIACKNEPKKPVDYTLFSGKITNKTGEKLILIGKDTNKEITVNEEGSFSDTLRVKDGVYALSHGPNRTPIYIAKGKHVDLNADAKEFNKTLGFKGDGAKANTYLADWVKWQQAIDIEELLSSDQATFDGKLEEFKKEHINLLEPVKTEFDSLTLADLGKGFEGMTMQLKQMHQQKAGLKNLKGQPSPAFNYENHKGGTTALADLKGKYVYIDVWATWCGPCKKEIPHLKALEKEYHGKKIAFVSISLDQNKDAWTKMVTEQELSGIQLHYGGDQTFTTAYQVTGIPRFILLDPEGNVVDANAPRPSDAKMKELLNSLAL